MLTPPIFRRLQRTLLLILLATFCHGAARNAEAQSISTASKAIGLSAYGGVTRISPDYGDKADYGFFVGGDAVRHFRRFELGLDARYVYGTGPVVGEHSFLGGLRAGKTYRRFHPYGDVEVGAGTITFGQPILFATGPYTHDNSVVLALGGGLDYDVSSRFAIKGDAQYQKWKLGSESNGLTPFVVSAGVVYRFPFKALRGRR